MVTTVVAIILVLVSAIVGSAASWALSRMVLDSMAPAPARRVPVRASLTVTRR